MQKPGFRIILSWIKLRKIKKLMENESWRLYMLSRLNQSTQREDNTEEDFAKLDFMKAMSSIDG